MNPALSDAALPQAGRRKAHGDGTGPWPVPRLAGVGRGRLSAVSCRVARRAA